VSAFDSVQGFVRYTRGLRRFLAESLPEPAARKRIVDDLARREESFLMVLQRGVFESLSSPYRRLFARAGIELTDVARMVRDGGLESALSRLHEEGVWLSIAEVKGKELVRRGDWTMKIEPGALHNPLVTGHFEASTSGSRSSGGTPFWVDLADTRHSSAYAVLACRGFELDGARGAIWFPAPPGVAGIRRALWWSKTGVRLERWFAQTVPRWRGTEIKRAVFVRWTVSASRRAGRPIPQPELTPPADALRVARWLSQSGPRVFFGAPSSGLRVCEAAAEAGLDLSGTFFSFGGEPYTETKARAIELAGGRVESSYYISELGGPIALGCPHGRAIDEAHIAEDRVAVIERERTLAGGAVVRPLYVTTISPLAPQVAINVETGDYAIQGSAACGCPYEEAGLMRTLHTIRSYEKLSTEGMHFFAPQLVALLEDVLPQRFGGGPTDYQLVEEEGAGGRSRIVLCVAPRLGPLDEHDVAETALSFLRSQGPAESMMAKIWEAGETLQVARREPVVTQAGKVLPLQVSLSRDDSSRAQA
jgi:hypothetical protein